MVLLLLLRLAASCHLFKPSLLLHGSDEGRKVTGWLLGLVDARILPARLVAVNRLERVEDRVVAHARLPAHIWVTMVLNHDIKGIQLLHPNFHQARLQIGIFLRRPFWIFFALAV